jgi:hypothetical protein
MTLPKRPNGGELQTTQNPSPTHWPASLISGNVWTILLQTQTGGHPGGLYWICGKQVYTVLPSSWFGSCVLGSIRPSFFLLPLRQGEKLGVPISEERLSRQKRGALRIGNWQDDAWPPERFTQYYGPATRAEDGS